MIQGIGTDIIEIDRIRHAVERHGQAFLDRIYTKKEQEYCHRFNDPAPRLAARFAAKEAVLKAMGTGLRGGLTMADIEIHNDDQGKPHATCREVVYHLSMSHSRDYATAVAILES